MDGSLIDVEVVPNSALQLAIIMSFAVIGVLVYDVSAGRVVGTSLSLLLLSWNLSFAGHRLTCDLVEKDLQPVLNAVSVDSAELSDVPAPGMSRPAMVTLALTAIVCLTGAVLWWLVYLGRLQFSQRPVVDLAVIFWVVQAVWFLWLVVASGWSLIVQSRVIAGFVLAEVLWTWLFVVDGYAGDGRPLLALRPLTRTPVIMGQQMDEAVTSAVRFVDLTAMKPDDYPEFRGGPQRDGIVSRTRLNIGGDAWPPRILWQQPVGAGWSAFAIAGDYAITQEQRGEMEAVVCYEIATGQQCWIHKDQTLFHEMMGGDGPRATPTIHEGRVYALGATGLLNCLDGRDGRLIWTANILSDHRALNSLFGMAGSPLVWREFVVVAPGGNGASLVAYHRKTGQEVWAAGDAAAAYAAPQLALINGREEILNFNAEGLFAHAPDDGRILWSFPWVTPPERNNVCQPVLWQDPDGRDTVFIGSGYGKGCALLEIVTTEDDESANALWQNTAIKPKFSSAVQRDGHLYGLDDNILCCVDLRSGRRLWKSGRYGHGQLMLVGDLLLIVTEDGEIVLREANPESSSELARLPVLQGRTWTHPALAGNRLLIRNDRTAACVELTVSRVP